MKKCLNCNEEIIIPETTNNYLKSNFRFKKFCNDGCRIAFNNKNNKKIYVLKESEHNDKLKELNNLIKGNIVFARGQREGYYPDLTKEDTDYEFEIFRNMVKMKKKAKNWEKSRKHVLVIGISDQTKNLFDEVYFFINKSLIRET